MSEKDRNPYILIKLHYLIKVGYVGRLVIHCQMLEAGPLQRHSNQDAAGKLVPVDPLQEEPPCHLELKHPLRIQDP